MSETKSAILEDERKIETIFFYGPSESIVKVGHGGVVEIVAYGEPGPYCLQPWLLVRHENDADARYNAANVEGIRYFAATLSGGEPRKGAE